ncbi:hypothetical protein [Kineosporia babensis]|uniref:Uncharacterized protein n=1 Tax=Kineosporia babensis TaxID=499548 RepID=A0A9X1NCG3_9ACTN|nr:hypothetical protein [Kineosporia babensis]MCD5312412.1 hypothetical protein [Kineosporia babensis]
MVFSQLLLEPADSLVLTGDVDADKQTIALLLKRRRRTFGALSRSGPVHRRVSQPLCFTQKHSVRSTLAVAGHEQPEATLAQNFRDSALIRLPAQAATIWACGSA